MMLSTAQENALTDPRRKPATPRTQKTFVAHQGAARISPQVCAGGPTMRFLVDDRPPLAQLSLPGPRRELEGRGGATARLDVLRYLIRCPLLPVLARAIAPRSAGRPAAYPDLFWLFFATAAREFASLEALGAELKTHWTEVCKEFFFEHGVRLPTMPGVKYASFNAWRTTVILDRERQLDRLLEQFTAASLALALAVRHAEGGDDERDLLHPAVWDCVAADGTVRNAPSDVRCELTYDDEGNEHYRYTGSRADKKHPERARVHEAVTAVDKPSGSPTGLYNVAATTKGKATYTRTVVSVDIGEATDAELPVAERMLHRFYRYAADAFPVLLYDGALTAVTGQEFMHQYGTFWVNANHARGRRVSSGKGESQAHTFDGDSTLTGEGIHRYGNKRGRLKRTWVTALPDLPCSNGDTPHVHHLAADDGAVYELDRPALKGGTSTRLGVLTPTKLERLQGDGYYFRLTLTRECPNGGTFTLTQDLRKTGAGGGSVGWREPIANVRIIPDVVEQYPEVMGHRNQAESFFSWLEKCYYRHDRAASWGREAQLFDLLSAALLHNAETWAHLAYRHPGVAARLALTLAAVPTPDLSAVKKKPESKRKRAQMQALHPTPPTSSPSV